MPVVSNADEPLSRFAGFAARLLHVPIAVVSAEGHTLGLAVANPRQRQQITRHFDRLRALCERVAGSPTLVAVENGRESPLFPDGDVMEPFGTAMLAMPLSVARGGPRGCVIVFEDASRHWLSHDVGSLAEVASAVTYELERQAALVTSEHELQVVAEQGRVRAETAREREASLLAATLEATGDGILVVDLEERVARCNRRFLDMWRIDGERVVGEPLEPLLERARPLLVEPTDLCVRLEWLRENPEAHSSDLMRFHDGRVYEWTSHPQVLDGRVIGRVWGFRDVTARAELEARLAHQAYHDALTGLANRTQFRMRIERALDSAAAAGRSPEHIALLLLDLDGFKLVNDSAGHAAGDALLASVAERLLSATRGSDLIARIGGDEFGVLLDRVRCESDVLVVAERIKNAMREPFRVGATLMNVGTSIGIARGIDGMRSADIAPIVTDASNEQIGAVDALLRNADLALYEAKARGRGEHAVFEPSLHRAAMARVSLEGQLRRGLHEGQFHLVYQPIVALDGSTPVGFEALVRWQHPERGLVMPGDFIATAEETGLIVPLGKWVLEQATRQAAKWSRMGWGDGDTRRPTITVNVSGRQLQHHTFVDDVESALQASGLPADCLTLELTESIVIQYSELALERLTALKGLGVRLAIDDFGTGYSALAYLQRFPFDVLKIDKSFVDRVAEGGRGEALANAIVGLGKALSLRTIAEGVESTAQRDALATMGCDCGQGFLFARAMVGQEVDALISRGLLATCFAR